MPPYDSLSPEQLEAWRARLSQWQSPRNFIDAVDQLMSQIGNPQYFNDPRVGFALDAWVGAKLASVTEASEVRLGSPPWPDYEERSAGGVAEFEITEADIQRRQTKNS